MKLFQRISLLVAMAFPLLTVMPAGAQSAPAATKEKKEKKAAAVPMGPVDLNTASTAELVAIKGIGPATAKKIIAGRPYAAVSDLSKAGLSAKQIAEFTPMVKVSTPVAKATPAAPQASSPAAAAPATGAKTTKYSPAATAAPGGGAGMVWVNTDTKVFHRQGDRWYGRTKDGKYLSEADALKAGYRESKEKVKVK